MSGRLGYVGVAAMMAAMSWLGAAYAAPALERPVGGRVLLAFGAGYREDGAERTHRGLDLAAAAGEEVRACAGGTVTFAGLVPGGDGSRTTAVTVACADGDKVTYMPLSSAEVRTGARVEAGDRLGDVGATGDASSAEPHLHLSVRTGDLYLDPAALLAEAAPEPVTPPAPEPAHAPEAPHVEAPAPRPAAPAMPPALRPVPAPSAPVPSVVRMPAPRGTPSPVADALPQFAGDAGRRARSRSPEAAPLTPTSASPKAASTPRPVAESAPPALFPRLAAVYGGARRVSTWIAELIVACAFLWPVWKRLTAPGPGPSDAVPVRVRA